MRRQHLVEFEDKSAQATGLPHDGISTSYSGDEALSQFEVNGISFISGNSTGLAKLGELLVQIGKSDYKSGFHLHIHEDFDEEKRDILIIGLN